MSHLPQKTLLICTAGRSMSWTFCRCLKEAGLGNPGEWLGAACYNNNAAAWAPELTDDGSSEFALAWVAAVARETSANGIFASKLMFSNFLDLLTNPYGRELMENAVLVWLERAEPRAQVTSLAAAIESGQWLSGDAQTTPSAPKTPTKALLTRSIQESALDTAGWRSFFAMTGLKPITLRDTDLKQDMPGALETVASAMGVTIDAQAAAKAGGAYDGAYMTNLAGKKRLDAACTDLFSDLAYRRDTYCRPVDFSPPPALKTMRRKLRHSLRRALKMQTTPRKGRR